MNTLATHNVSAHTVTHADIPTKTLRDIAQHAALCAVRTTAVTMPYFLSYARGNTEFETKTDNSPVTRADKNAEQQLRDDLIGAYPGTGIIGEEFSPYNTKARYVWIIDPIDGTRTFIRGVPLYTTLIALFDTQAGIPLIGCAYCPPTGELMYAYKNGGAKYTIVPHYTPGDTSSSIEKFLLSARLCIEKAQNTACDTTTTSIQKSLLLSYDWVRAIDVRQSVYEVMKRADLTRTWADGYGYMLLASARAQAVLDASMHLWDIVPVYTIITEAGGQVCDFTGHAINFSGLYTCALAAKNDSNEHADDATCNVLSCANEALADEITVML